MHQMYDRHAARLRKTTTPPAINRHRIDQIVNTLGRLRGEETPIVEQSAAADGISEHAHCFLMQNRQEDD